MKWYVGQRVVCIKTHESTQVIKEGEIFTILGLKKSGCKCGHIVIDIGLIRIGNYDTTTCLKCMINNDGIWFHESRFAPIDELSDYTVETLLNEIEEPLKVNNNAYIRNS